MSAPRRIRAWTAAQVCALGPVLFACPAPEPEETVGPPTRLISLTPVVTETLLALGATGALVAVSDFCPPHPALAGLPRVGTGLVPQLEPIARLRPDLILTERTSGVDVRLLGRVAPVRAWPWRTLADARTAIESVGQVAGVPDRARDLAERFAQALAPQPPRAPVSVLGVLGYGALRPGEVWYIRSDSLHGSAFRAAGLRLVPREAPTGPPRMSYEALITLDPGAIVVFATDAGTATTAAAAFAALRPLAAPRAGRVFSVVDPRVFSTGPRLIELVATLKRDVTTPLAPGP